MQGQPIDLFLVFKPRTLHMLGKPSPTGLYLEAGMFVSHPAFLYRMKQRPPLSILSPRPELRYG